jgi:hypothetical protein
LTHYLQLLGATCKVKRFKTFLDKIFLDRQQQHKTAFAPNLPTSITRHPPCSTKPLATPPNATEGVLMPWIRRTFRPSSGPHSYTRKLPYGLRTSRVPGKAFGGYGSFASSSGDSVGKSDVKGEGTGSVERCVWVASRMRTIPPMVVKTRRGKQGWESEREERRFGAILRVFDSLAGGKERGSLHRLVESWTRMLPSDTISAEIRWGLVLPFG